MKRELTGLRIFNVIAFLAMITVNIMAQVMPLAGLSTEEISALYPTLLTPVGMTFSIWLLIYIAVGWFAIQQLFSGSSAITKNIGIWFIISCALNIAWIFSWHYRIMLLAVIAIAALWVVLLMINQRIRSDKWHLKCGFSVYYAWITAATAIQLFIFLSGIFSIENGSTTSVVISVMAILVLTLFAFVKVVRGKDDWFGLTIGWALLGMLLSQIGTTAAVTSKAVEMICLLGILVIIASCAWVRTRISKGE